ncbi:transketolase family protein [Gryllotalpicola reticulitermitis]|uniref:Transketolase family protein n=1 Tax=Gryllotalpicola reticulitermitis TaxID=1184153 RepID=A0ABV8Q3T1_9MICO
MTLTEQPPITDRQPLRAGFGRGLVAAGHADHRVVALCADLTESTMMTGFADAFPARFIEVGVAEQNLVTVASGMAHAGKIPFAASYAAFSPGRNWEQIKTTAALNDMPVKIVGAHAGINVGPDGATHQMLEDIALMRVMPNMVVVAPGDATEAEQATLAVARDPRPVYLRLARAATPLFLDAAPFVIGQARRLRDGSDVTLAGTGTLTYQLLVAADRLAELGIAADLVHFPTIKPLDDAALLESAARTRLVVTAEEGQRAGGFGGAVTEVLAAELPTRVLRIGIDDRYGESGEPDELLAHFGLTGDRIAEHVHEYITRAKGSK